MRPSILTPLCPLFLLVCLAPLGGCLHAQRITQVEQQLLEVRREVRAHEQLAELRALEMQAQRDVDRALESRRRERTRAAAEPVSTTGPAWGRAVDRLRPWPEGLESDARP